MANTEVEQEEMKTKLDRYHWHEALDRTSFIGEIVEEHLAKHALIRSTPKFKSVVTQVGNLLGELYQELGQDNPYWKGDNQ